MSDEAMGIFFGLFSGIYLIFFMVIAFLIVVGSWKFYEKAGKPGWAAIVPFYNTYCLYEMTFGNGWMFLISLVPCVNVIFQFILCIKLAKAFGKGTGFGIGLIFLYPIFVLILGLGSAQYIGIDKN